MAEKQITEGCKRHFKRYSEEQKEKVAAAKKKEAEDANKKKDLERAREKASRETDAYRGIEKIDKKISF